jgi:signal peptidase II
MTAVPKHERAGALWLLLSLAIVVADQLTKAIATAELVLHRPVPVFDGFFNWTLAHNYGVAFSIFNDGPGWQRYGLSAFALLVSTVFTVWLLRLPRHERWSAAGLALVVGGAIGNVIDRLRLGYVVDFIEVYWNTWHWPAFNIADSAICVGAAVLVIASLRGEKREVAPSRAG